MEVKKNSLGKSQRLKSRKQIDFLFDSGLKISVFPYRMLYRKENSGGFLKTAFSVSSRNFPLAVDRNRIKRLCREIYRTRKGVLEEEMIKNNTGLYLFIIYTGREMMTQQKMIDPFNQLMDKLGRLLHENNSANS